MKTKGFLLFEVLVAILVATTALIAIMQGVSSALKIRNRTQSYFKAIVLAESKMAMLQKEVAWKTETTSGEFSKDLDPDGVFSWVQVITPVVSDTWSSAEPLPVNEAKVQVKWDGYAVELVTYVTKYEESRAER